MKNIYALQVSFEEDDHELDLDDFNGDWEELLTNEAHSIELNTSKPDRFKDFFAFAGTIGIASDQLASQLSSWAGARLKLRSVLIDGRNFQILLQGKPVDILDHKRSKYSTFESDPTTIKQIHVFMFHCEILPDTPFAFTIPESTSTLFVTEEAASILRQGTFKGIQLVHILNYRE